jgi:hypothetical protein
VNNEDGDRKIAIAKMMAQKQVSKKSGPVVRKKVSIKKPTVEQIIRPKLSDNEKSTELQNLMELIDIKGIIQELVQKELTRLGFINMPVTETFIDPNISETDDPMDIDIARIENENDLATVEGKIGDVVVSIVVDSASNKDIMPKLVADELGLKIDTSDTRSIRGVSGENKSLGITSASIKLASGCVIEIEPIVIDDYPIREIILGRTTLRRYNYDLHESRKHMVITCNEKNFFIPIVPDKNRQSKLAIKKSLVLKALSANNDNE